MQKFKSILASFAYIYIYICIINFPHLYSQIPLKTITLDGQQVMVAANELCVKLKNGVSDQTLRNFVAQYGGTVDPLDFNSPLRWRVIKFSNQASIDNLFTTFKSTNLFEKVEYNFAGYSQEVIPNDPYFTNQWNLKNTLIPNEDLGLTMAWNITKGADDVILAVFDTGIPMVTNGYSLSHSDLDDMNKFILGINVTSEFDSLRDNHGHGTKVIGILGAEVNNSLGISGFCWYCKILIIKGADNRGISFTSYFRRAIEYITKWKYVNNKQKVVLNVSYNYAYYNPDLKQLEDAVYLANENGILIVVAMGNDAAKPHIKNPLAVLSLKYKNVISVGAVKVNGERASYSSYGSHINVVAPGGDSDYQIFTTTPNYSVPNGTYNLFYDYATGTSLATPHVSGLAGLILSLEYYEPSLIRKIIQDYARDKFTSGFDYYYGYGIIDVYKTILAVNSRPKNLRFVNFNNKPKIIWDGLINANGYFIYKAVVTNENSLEYELLDYVSSNYNYYVDLAESIDPSQMVGKKVAYRVSALLNSQQIIETAPSNRVIVSVNGLGLEKSFNNFNYKLYQNYPNPFNSITKVRFSINDFDIVNFELINPLGQTVKTYNLGILSPGEHEIELDLFEFPSGIYYYKIQSKKFSDIKKMILLK